MKTKRSVFDICGTLYKSNTTFDFLDYYLRANKVYRIYKIVSTTILWKVLNKITKYLVKCDITRMIAILFIKGHTKQELLDAADSFFKRELKLKENKYIIESFHRLNSNKENQVIIASATLDFIAQTIARHLNCKTYFSTTLSYEDGICKGTIVNDLLGRKVRFLNRYKSFENVYTDDISDCSLLELAENKYLVVYPKTFNKWKKIVKKNHWNAIFINI